MALGILPPLALPRWWMHKSILHVKCLFIARLWQIIPKKVPILLFNYSQNFCLLFSWNQPIIPKYSWQFLIIISVTFILVGLYRAQNYEKVDCWLSTNVQIMIPKLTFLLDCGCRCYLVLTLSTLMCTTVATYIILDSWKMYLLFSFVNLLPIILKVFWE